MIFLLVLISLFGLFPSQEETLYKKKGVWQTTYFGATTKEEAENTFLSLIESNVNEIYVSCFHEGQTTFDSQTMRNFIGEEGINSMRNLEWLLEAREKYNKTNSVKIYAWFEFGWIASISPVSAANLPFYNKIKSEGWLLENGKVADDFIWMNYTNSQIQDFIVGITSDSLNSLPIDGVQFDDHLCIPETIGGSAQFDQVTKAALYVWNEVKKKVKRNFEFLAQMMILTMIFQ